MLDRTINRAIEIILRKRYKGLFLFDFDRGGERPVIGNARAAGHLEAPRRAVGARLTGCRVGDLD